MLRETGGFASRYFWVEREWKNMPQNEGVKEELAKKAGSIRASGGQKQPVPGKGRKGAAAGNDTTESPRFIRLLRADEIECRIAVINEKGLSLLLYKDARVDQKILDETFGMFGWKRSHQSIDGNLYCTVEIWDECKGQWIAKQDVGTVSYSEKEKGQASDSFKRACFNCVYTSRIIQIYKGAPQVYTIST
jgi:hypothetical protein